MSDDAAALWERYKANPTPEDREALILRYMPLVGYMAARLGRSLHSTVEHQDLVSYGTFGLIDAIDKYDPERPVKFETYAVNRIRGAIYDELRELDWAPRSVRAKARAVKNAVEKLSHELDRPPTMEEVLTVVDMTEAEYRHLEMELRADHFDSLDRQVGSQEGTQTHGDGLVERDSDMSHVPQLEEAKLMLAEAVAGLSDHDRTMLSLFYCEGLSLREISEVLQVGESRVSQMQTRAMVNFQRRLAGQS